MQGFVDEDMTPVLPLTVRGFNGQEIFVEAVLDTGFTEFLTLPPSLIAELGLLVAGEEWVSLADGSEIQVSVYTALVVWNGVEQITPIQEQETDALVGVKLLQNQRLTADFVPGGAVTVAAIS